MKWRRLRSSPTPTAPNISAIPISGAVPVSGLDLESLCRPTAREHIADRARPAAEIGPGRPRPYESDQTTHFSIVDADGNAVSNTYTLNLPYGSASSPTEPACCSTMNSTISRPSRGAANAYRGHRRRANAPGPNKRPLSSMSPTMVFKDGELEIVTGSPGGSRIITTCCR